MLKLLQIFGKKDIFASYQKEVNLSIKKAQKKIENNKKREFFSLSKNPLEQIRQITSSLTKKLFNVNIPTTEIKIVETPPPSLVKADLTISGFALAQKIDKILPQGLKGLKKTIIELSKELAEGINNSNSLIIEKAEAIDGFINLSLKQPIFYSQTLQEINNQKGDFGSSDINTGKIVIIDYSSPNVAKPIGVGHMRSTNIGQALKNILEKTGYTVIGHNYIGDWGTQFGKLIYAYQNWGNKEKIKENPLTELKNLYVQFHEEAEKNPELENKAREIFKKLEQKNPELLQLWKEFRDLSIGGIKKTYQRLGIDFDLWFGESYFNELSKEIIKECLDKKIAYKDPETGAIIADPAPLSTFLLQKQDGSTLYSARDLASLKFRLEKFNPDEVLYVVGDDQKLYFSQIFNLAEKLGFSKETLEHIGFGLVLNGGEKMSTRKGSLIELDDLLDEAIKQSENIIKQKNSNLNKKEIEEISKILGIGAIIYNDIRQSRERNISFNWDKMFNFENGSSIYLQYTYVRIQSILKKIGEISSSPQNIVFEKSIEFNLVKKLALFPFIIIKAEKISAPHLIATYLEELAQLFNNFYNEVNVINTENKDLLDSRIILINSVALVIKNGLSILNIKVPEKM
jgi:arginyl-tRNA synthetase